MKSMIPMLCVVLAVLAGCRGGGELRCASDGAYLAARETARVKAPGDLDDLDVLREAPLPDASPRPQRPAGAGCLDAPPELEEDQ